jgi:hypothetical protein
MITQMEFKDFDKNVSVYYPLNKSKSRFLIWFYSGDFAFYKFNKKFNSFIREDSILANLSNEQLKEFLE